VTVVRSLILFVVIVLARMPKARVWARPALSK
jgi:hypothetical protein